MHYAKSRAINITKTINIKQCKQAIEIRSGTLLNLDGTRLIHALSYFRSQVFGNFMVCLLINSGIAFVE